MDWTTSLRCLSKARDSLREGTISMIPFRNLLHLFIGDFLAKVLNFLAFVYLARVLGVTNYGVLEFALSALTYFLVLADGGLELWGIREAARGKDKQQLVGRVTPLRFLLALCAFDLLLILLPTFPTYPYLKTILVFFGLTLFSQAANLKWIFMGQEKMARVGAGLATAQIIFSIAVFMMVREPADILWIPILRLISDLTMVVYFGHRFLVTHKTKRVIFTFSKAQHILKPAFIMGLSHGLAFMSYNFDSLLLGILVGAASVGWYSAAYKPITAILAIPVTYFVGLFPTLSRTYTTNIQSFCEIVTRSLRLAAILALPVGIGGTFLAKPIIYLLFGTNYTNSILPLQILSWAAVLVILRGTYRQALNAAGQQKLDLRCAGLAMTINVGLNLIIIPQYGIVGAALTTLTAEAVWLILASYYFYHHVNSISLLPYLLHPIAAAGVMSICFLLTQPLFWVAQASIAIFVYFYILLLTGETEVRSWVQTGFRVCKKLLQVPASGL